MLVEGPTAFRMSMVNVNSRDEHEDQGIEDLCHFIGYYVGNTYGVRAINTWTRENKGKTFLDKMTVDDVTYCVALLQNHEQVWEQDAEKARSDETKKLKYKNYMQIVNEEERAKYAPRNPRFSAGAGVKQEFGKEIWNEDGRELYREIRRNWSRDMSDKNTWLWLEDIWNGWVKTSGFCRHWKLKDCGSAEDEDERAECEDETGLMLLPGDEGFASGKEQKWLDEDGEGLTEVRGLHESEDENGETGGERGGNVNEVEGGVIQTCVRERMQGREVG